MNISSNSRVRLCIKGDGYSNCIFQVYNQDNTGESTTYTLLWESIFTLSLTKSESGVSDGPKWHTFEITGTPKAEGVTETTAKVSLLLYNEGNTPIGIIAFEIGGKVYATEIYSTTYEVSPLSRTLTSSYNSEVS